jgi:heat shock protein HslJ
MLTKQIILLLIVLDSVYSETVAWQGVSDFGGRGVGVVTGSRTVRPDGFTSSSSSSSFSSGPGSSSSRSTPKTTLTVYSTNPVNIRTNSPSSTTIQSSTSSRNSVSQSLVGDYQVTNVNGLPVDFEVNIDESQIGYKYCNTKGMKYSSTGSSIKVSPGFSTKMLCSNLSPSEYTIDNAFTSATSYSVSSNVVTFYKNGVICLVLNRI